MKNDNRTCTLPDSLFLINGRHDGRHHGCDFSLGMIVWQTLDLLVEQGTSIYITLQTRVTKTCIYHITLQESTTLSLSILFALHAKCW